jgi:diguanylate cyclase (GGDEF)-like protein/PAS domain S-box-containing protein
MSVIKRMTDDSVVDERGAVSCRLIRNEVGLITAVDDSIVDVLGWTPEQLVGSPSTGLLHPDDQASGVASWLEMTGVPGSTGTWRGRYQAADGGWRWVETVNSNHLDDPDGGYVLSIMRPITVSDMSVEEELRARKQLLVRLADALPVGVFQIDRHLRVEFTNDRLHEILGVPHAADVATLFSVILEADRLRLESGVKAALNNESVNELELRFSVAVPHPDFAATRVCEVSLRPLTDSDGSVSGTIGCLSDVTDSVELRRELEIRAAVDGLTGCLNRTATFELLDIALRQRSSASSGLAVIFIDLDRFKEVNDRLGHAAGDQALVLAADRIREAVRVGDSVGRVGGDEFLAICPDVPSVDAATPVAQRISEALRTSHRSGDVEIRLGASVGVAWCPLGECSPDALIARADRAMYESKLSGTGAVAIAS